jgi:hypothetical protein
MGRELNVAELWRQITQQDFDTTLLVHLLFELGHVTATFAAVDRPDAIADAIGNIFDAILVSTRRFRGDGAEEWDRRSRRGAEELPRTVQVDGPLVTVDPLQAPVSIFNA